MACTRVEALDERVRTLRKTVDRLCEEHTVVRGRIHSLASAGDGTPDRECERTPATAGSAWPDAGFSHQPATPTVRDGDRRDEASDAEVAAAIRAVEADLTEEADDNGNEEHRAEIIVA